MATDPEQKPGETHFTKLNFPQRVRQRLLWFFASGTRKLALFLLAIGLPGVIPGPLGDVFPSGLVRFHTAISAELVGMALAVLLIDTANELRSGREQKEALILQMGSPDNGFAVEAIRQLRVRGWLTDGSLEGADLIEANLHEAKLREANLQCALVFRANLQEANLIGANLRGAWLREANLQGANLWMADLRETDLWAAKLQDAGLERANLQAADLQDAHLHGAGLSYVNLQRATLQRANLQGVHLWFANLKNADLQEANLQGARLWNATLQGTHLRGAKLQGADLAWANLLGATSLTLDQLREAKSLSGATMPDGTELPHEETGRDSSGSSLVFLLGPNFSQEYAGSYREVVTWRDAFEVWCETVEVDEDGFIVPTQLDDSTDEEQ